MISAADNSKRVAPPTLWGLTPVQLHDRYWASRGVQVVRQGERSEIVGDAELFLLTDPRSLLSFRIERLVEKLYWDEPDVLCLRIHDEREHGYLERVVTDARGRFVKFERIYGGSDARLARVTLTRDAAIARAWQRAESTREAWRRVRRGVPRAYRATASVNGHVYDRAADEDVAHFVRHLVAVWQRPDTTIRRAVAAGGTGWRDRDAHVATGAHVVGAVWVGAGRRLEASASVIGPTVLWDDAVARPAVDDLEWEEIEPTELQARRVQPRAQSSTSLAAKRVFDIAFASAFLLATLPLYPLIMLAIWLEDGRPFFFGHMRETLGGREFACWKFRSMRKDAEQIKAQLKAANQADGPQFFMEEDPRLTRIGRLLRKCNLDELPQFWNVLKGDMSVVGPRPSPRSENQFCPPWREARLSVKPGITGLWQVKRTRVAGLDFQEWIKYDIEYVERAGWGMDASILWQTVTTILRGIIRS